MIIVRREKKRGMSQARPLLIIKKKTALSMKIRMADTENEKC